jgi:hypothetical protein
LTGAFVPNRWHVAIADDPAIGARYAGFEVALAFPCWAANQWLTAVVRGLADALTALHLKGLAAMTDPQIADDRGRAIVAQSRIDLTALLSAPQRPSLKAVKR